MDRRIHEACARLGAALTQTVESDDQIIVEHIREAHLLLEAVVREDLAAQQGPSLRAGKQTDPDPYDALLGTVEALEFTFSELGTKPERLAERDFMRSAYAALAKARGKKPALFERTKPDKPEER